MLTCLKPSARPSHAALALLEQPLRDAVNGDNPAAAHEAYRRFRVLTVLRHGPLGLQDLTEWAEGILTRGRVGSASAKAQWAGRPLLVTQNDPRLGVFNGDVGIVLPDPNQGGALRVALAGTGGTYRWLAIARLPTYESALALTVHKAQGSEFEHVAVVLPVQESPILRRELLYTALTRARSRVTVVATEEAIVRTIERRTERHSGLRSALWDG